MNHAVGRVFDIVFAAARAQVPILVPVALEVAPDRRCQGVATDVELPTLVQQRPLNVLLNDVAALMAIDLLRLDQLLYMVQIAADLDTAAPVCVLAGLDDP